jgi:hypothetical protein
MPSTLTAVDRALERCQLLARIVDLEYQRALANPTDERYVTLIPVVKEQEKQKKAGAKLQIEQAFGDLVALVDHLTILDMAAALEFMFSARIATAVGAARRTLATKHRGPVLAGRAGVVRDTKDFQGLGDITTLISADLDDQVRRSLESVRENRNRFAHGTDLRNPPTILQEDARDALNAAADLLQAV